MGSEIDEQNNHIWVREIFSCIYKLWLLLPALLLFPQQRFQSIDWRWSRFWCVVLWSALMLGLWWKLFVQLFFPSVISEYIYTYIFVLIVNSIVEEYVFRWMIVEYCRVLWWDEIQSVLISSVLFALAHIPMYILFFHRSGILLIGSLLWIFFFGLAMSYIKKRTDSLLSPIVFHSIHNGILIFCSLFSKK